MSDDVAARLRSLARDHACGRLSLHAYRRLRAPLLDALAPGVAAGEGEPDGEPDVTQPRIAMSGAALPRWQEERGPAPEPQPNGAEAARPFHPPARERAAPRARRPSPLRATGVPVGAALLLAAAAASVLVLLNRHDSASRGGPVAATRTRAEPQDLERIRELVAALQSRPDWADERIVALDAALLEIGPARIAAAQDRGWFESFTDAVRQRLKEQQALEGSARPDQSPLADLAVTLGIDPSAPDRTLRTDSGTRAGGAPAEQRSGRR